jgi:hypothetical protein
VPQSPAHRRNRTPESAQSPNPPRCSTPAVRRGQVGDSCPFFPGAAAVTRSAPRPAGSLAHRGDEIRPATSCCSGLHAVAANMTCVLKAPIPAARLTKVGTHHRPERISGGGRRSGQCRPQTALCRTNTRTIGAQHTVPVIAPDARCWPFGHHIPDAATPCQRQPGALGSLPAAAGCSTGDCGTREPHRPLRTPRRTCAASRGTLSVPSVLSSREVLVGQTVSSDDRPVAA